MGCTNSSSKIILKDEENHQAYLAKKEIAAQLGLADSQSLNQLLNGVSLVFIELRFSAQQKESTWGRQNKQGSSHLYKSARLATDYPKDK